MEELRMKKYANLIAEIGANVKKGEEVWIRAELDQPDFIVLLVEECYRLGAKRVRVNWNHLPLSKLT
ncbi:MAG: aminopeptidase, partial [Bacilli bacterium]